MFVPTYTDYKVHADGLNIKLKPYTDRSELNTTQQEKQKGLRIEAQRWLDLCRKYHPELSRIYAEQYKQERSKEQ